MVRDVQVLTMRHSATGGVEGAVALALALRKHAPDMEVVHINYNDIGDEGAVELAKQLRHPSWCSFR